ncbi:MAG: FAD:protein FMN transferase [Moraxella sp.]|nr:FAD:protein FMN transferase [Moraxella sp.]
MRFLALVAVCGLMMSCSPTPNYTKLQYTKLQGETMGTSYHIRFEMPNNAELNSIQADIDKRLASINNSMSTYQDDSTISRFNRLKAGEVITIDGDFIKVLDDSRVVYAASQGSFDPTVYPLVELWGFGKSISVERLQNPPSTAEISAIKDKIGLDKVVLTGNVLSKTVDGVGLDFSAIAKGYGVDVIAEVLKNQYHINNYMVEIGGEVATLGVNDKGKPWMLAIDKPIADSTVSQRAVMTTLSVNEANIATSGNYRNSMTWNDVRYSHTINPKTAKPVANGVPSVTVLHDSVALADAWATALTAVPQDEAIVMANTHGIKAIFVEETADNKGFGLIYSEVAEGLSP